MRTFELHRFEDETGVSGTGVVAEGCIFADGWVAMRWLNEPRTTTLFPSIEVVEHIHGHNGKTKIVALDEELAEAKKDLESALAQREEWRCSDEKQRTEVARLRKDLDAALKCRRWHQLNEQMRTDLQATLRALVMVLRTQGLSHELGQHYGAPESVTELSREMRAFPDNECDSCHLLAPVKEVIRDGASACECAWPGGCAERP